MRRDRGFDAIRRQPRNQTGREQRNQYEAAEHPQRGNTTPKRRLRRLVAVADSRHRDDRPINAVAQADHRGVRPRSLGTGASLDDPHRDADQDQHRNNDENQGAELGDSRPIGREGKKQPRFPSRRDRYPGPVGGIGEVDARRPFRRDRDSADGGVVAALLQAAEDRLHIRNRDQLEWPFHQLRHPAPQIDADAGNRAVTVDVAVGRNVIDGDAQGLRFVLLRGKGGNDRRRQTSANDDPDEENSGEPPDTAIPPHLPPPCLDGQA